MAKLIEPITAAQLAEIDLAVLRLRQSIKLLAKAKAPKALDRARAALKSAEGAQRHAYHRYNRSIT